MTSAFLERLESNRSATALIADDVPYTYAAILEARDEARAQLDRELSPGALVSFVPEFTPRGVGTFLAMMERNDIVILCPAARLPLVEVDQFLVEAGDAGVVVRERHKSSAPPLAEELRRRGHPGLAFLSSGTTGTPKIVLHDFDTLIAPFRETKKSRRTYAFLPFEQIGGFYNLLYSLSGGGVLVSDGARTPDRVARSIQDHKVALISCNPSFLRLFYMSGAHERFDLSSLEQINFGTEPMPASTLELLHAALPRVKLRQKFGMSEIGVIGATVEGATSPFLKLDASVCEARVRDGLLEVKSKTAMLGYLQGNGKPDQFTDDGWLRTGDMVEQRGDYIHILGRQSDLINVGGRKVLPQDVEEALQDFPGVVDVLVEAEPNAILGQVVRAVVVMTTETDPAELRHRIRQHCQAKGLASFQIPQRIVLRPVSEWNATMKKQRNLRGDDSGGEPAV